MTSATPETLMKQAAQTAKVYLIAAIEAIDSQFGENYAKAHPELVAAFMHAAASDYAANFAGLVAEEAYGL